MDQRYTYNSVYQVISVCSQSLIPFVPFLGKTPFAGQVAKMSHKWLGETAVVAVRFFGSSIQAEQIHPALR